MEVKALEAKIAVVKISAVIRNATMYFFKSIIENSKLKIENYFSYLQETLRLKMVSKSALVSQRGVMKAYRKR